MQERKQEKGRERETRENRGKSERSGGKRGRYETERAKGRTGEKSVKEKGEKDCTGEG